MKSIARLFVVLAACAAAGGTASAQSFFKPGPAGDSLIESYVAEIGPRDLVNSRGVRLVQPWQVLQQDRANYHRFGIRDRADQPDKIFREAANRAAFEVLLRAGSISAELAAAVVKGGAIVTVEIYGSAGTARAVMVKPARTGGSAQPGSAAPR